MERLFRFGRGSVTELGRARRYLWRCRLDSGARGDTGSSSRDLELMKNPERKEVEGPVEDGQRWRPPVSQQLCVRSANYTQPRTRSGSETARTHEHTPLAQGWDHLSPLKGSVAPLCCAPGQEHGGGGVRVDMRCRESFRRSRERLKGLRHP